jgi:hypothetical protein
MPTSAGRRERRRRLRRHLAWWTLLAAAAVAAGCGGGPAVPTGGGHDGVAGAGEPALAVEHCHPLPADAGPGADLVIALGQAVDPAHAPVPVNDAERTVFANLYETLTRVTCEGDVRPGLAESWQRLDEGRRWRVRLRPGAVFWDGTPADAGAVLAAWRRNEPLARATGLPCPALWVSSGSRGLSVLDARTLEIRLAEPQDDLPKLLAHPSLAVAAPRDGWTWPVGSGPCRLAADTPRPLPDLACRPNPHGRPAPRWRTLTFRIRPHTDARDLLPPGVDLTVVRDQQALDYYRGVPGVTTAPLPWDRLYIMLTPPDSPLDIGTALMAGEGAMTPAERMPWTRLDHHGCVGAECPQLFGPTLGAAPRLLDPDPAYRAGAARRLWLPEGDADARAVGERIAAFAPAGLDLTPADGPGLADAIVEGSAAAYLVTLDTCYPTACLALAALLARADWLQQAAAEADETCDAAAALMQSGRANPLLRTRPALVWRGPLAGLALAHDGALLVGDLGPAKAEVAP